METSEVRRWIRQAREIVKDEPEPYKIEAFKVILSKLIERGSISEILPAGVVGKKPGAKLFPGKIPDDILEKVSELELSNKEKIQILLYYAGRPLTKEEIKEDAKDLGIDEGWWNGSNFRRDLMKRSKLLVQQRDNKGEIRYRLGSVARASTKKLLERLS